MVGVAHQLADGAPGHPAHRDPGGPGQPADLPQGPTPLDLPGGEDLGDGLGARLEGLEDRVDAEDVRLAVAHGPPNQAPGALGVTENDPWKGGEQVSLEQITSL